MAKPSAPNNEVSDELAGFAPVARFDAQLLVLGSMPGVASLQAQQYYAHPRNAFWWIAGQICAAADFRELPYLQRCDELKSHRWAVWDVLQRCRREGSLDASIDLASARCNDFQQFFDSHTDVQLVILNGRTASTLFTKRVLPQLDRAPACVTVASTSPAMASLTQEDKLQQWQSALRQHGIHSRAVTTNP